MASYMVLWHANSTSWPVDPKQSLPLYEGVAAGADMLMKSGALRELGWFTAESGYAVIDADSKAAVLGVVEPFFPLYTQAIHEIVPWEAGKQAMLASARAAAAR